MTADPSIARPRWIRAIGWLALIAGWLLLWRGHHTPGYFALALFVLIRLMPWRKSAAPQQTAGPAADAAPVVDHIPQVLGHVPEVLAHVPQALDTPETALEPAIPPIAEHPDPDSYQPARWRQLVWVSYGNAFLQGNLQMEDWYRHSVTWEAVCHFRDGADRRLVARDGFEWLCALRQRGVLRLSLDIDETDPALAGIDEWDGQAITCHFADHRERWRMGEEIGETAQQAGALSWEQRQQAFPLWNRGGWLPLIDAYWRVAVLPDTVAEVPIDWSRELAAIQRELQGTTPVAYEPGPYYKHSRVDNPAWSRFPILPNDPALLIPHRLLAELVRRKEVWDNDTHPKNEGSVYALAQDNPATRRAIENYGELLLALIGRVQRLAGSETRWKPQPPPPIS
jgi:hypothetical protein